MLILFCENDLVMFIAKNDFMNNIAFVGGIHGAGKSTICRNICEKVKFNYLSASKLIKWEEFNKDVQNKKVNNIPSTQDRLISGLTSSIEKDKYYLLDGHYCLLNSENEIVNIPLDTFKLINPISLNIILGDVVEIKNKLKKRDGRPYDEGLLKQMQESELNYARYLSKTLSIPLNMGTKNDFSDLITSLRELINSRK